MVPALALVATIVASCSWQDPAPTPSPRATQVPAGARLTVFGQGTISCMMPHGCLPAVVVVHGDWPPPEGWEPDPASAEFDVEITREWVRRVRGRAKGLPDFLAPGSYTIIASVSEVSDLIGPSPNGTVTRGLLWTETCDAGLKIDEATTSVIAVVTFAQGDYEIDATTR